MRVSIKYNTVCQTFSHHKYKCIHLAIHTRTLSAISDKFICALSVYKDTSIIILCRFLAFYWNVIWQQKLMNFHVFSRCVKLYQSLYMILNGHVLYVCRFLHNTISKEKKATFIHLPKINIVSMNMWNVTMVSGIQPAIHSNQHALSFISTLQLWVVFNIDAKHLQSVAKGMTLRKIE